MKSTLSKIINNKFMKVLIIVFISFLVLVLSVTSFFLIGPEVYGYRTVYDSSIAGFFKPLAHIESTDDASYIFAYKCDEDHYFVVDDSDYIKKYKNTLVFLMLPYEKDSERYGLFTLYKDGVDQFDEELGHYFAMFSKPAQWQFNWIFYPVAKKLTVREFEEYCMENNLLPPGGVFSYVTKQEFEQYYAENGLTPPSDAFFWND